MPQGWLMCTIDNDHFPVTPVLSEGDVYEGVREHVREHGTDHAKHVRVAFTGTDDWLGMCRVVVEYETASRESKARGFDAFTNEAVDEFIAFLNAHPEADLRPLVFEEVAS